MKSLDEIQRGLKETGRLEVVAAQTGLSYFTLVRYRAGKVTRPALDTVVRLSDWLESEEQSADSPQ